MIVCQRVLVGLRGDGLLRLVGIGGLVGWLQLVSVVVVVHWVKGEFAVGAVVAVACI